MATQETTTKKWFIPLESDPTLFTELIHTLGMSKRLVFHDLLTLSPTATADDAELIAHIPRPVLALVVVIPAPDGYAKEIAREEREGKGLKVQDMCGEDGMEKNNKGGNKEEEGEGEGEDVVFYYQTIGNACGLYAVLHAVSNGGAREFVEPNTHISNLIQNCAHLPMSQKTRYLESDPLLEAAHASVASRGSTRPPEDITAHPPFAYMTFTKAGKGGRVCQFEGCRRGPVDLGVVLLGEGEEEEEDLLSEKALKKIREFIEREGKGASVGYSALALCLGA